MTRFFYTDPLAAAWMAKHFGMNFAVGGSMGETSRADGSPLDRRHVVSCDWPGGIRFYLHPGSLHLLEPQKGDLVFYDNLHGGEAWDEFRCVITRDDERYPYVGTGEPLMLMDGGEHPYRKELRRIIQRNSKPFHWPEHEAA